MFFLFVKSPILRPRLTFIVCQMSQKIYAIVGRLKKKILLTMDMAVLSRCVYNCQEHWGGALKLSLSAHKSIMCTPVAPRSSGMYIIWGAESCDPFNPILQFAICSF